MLNQKHGKNYLIYNLTGEPYDYSRFNGRVLDFDFPDHHPPPLEKYMKVITSMDHWMKVDKDHVAVVHCLAGRYSPSLHDSFTPLFLEVGPAVLWPATCSMPPFTAPSLTPLATPRLTLPSAILTWRAQRRART